MFQAAVSFVSRRATLVLDNHVRQLVPVPQGITTCDDPLAAELDLLVIYQQGSVYNRAFSAVTDTGFASEAAEFVLAVPAKVAHIALFTAADALYYGRSRVFRAVPPIPVPVCAPAAAGGGALGRYPQKKMHVIETPQWCRKRWTSLTIVMKRMNIIINCNEKDEHH
jgi:hypothetical protein